MINDASLTGRIIRAERELLALKTVHNRGLGTIRLYPYWEYVNKGATQYPVWCDIVFTINLSPKSEPYPLIKLYPQLTKVYVGIYFINTFTIVNNGYTILVSAEAVLPAAESSIPVKIMSTSDIQSVSYQIREEN